MGLKRVLKADPYKPAYKVIIDDIKKDIADGRYKADTMVPSQAQLAKQYNVSRITARDAINELVHRGILYTKQGKGTFVSGERKFTYPNIRFQGFGVGIARIGKKLDTIVLKLEESVASVQDSNQLGIPEGLPIVTIQRLRIVEDIPVVVTTSKLNKSLFPHIHFLEMDFTQVSLYETVQKKGDMQILYVDEEISAVRCPTEIAKHLQIDPGEPVLCIHRLAFNMQEVCFEWGKQYERTDIASLNLRSYSDEDKIRMQG